MDTGEEKHESTKTRLLEAAGEVFSRRGFRSATVRDICSRAGTHVGAVNYHFRDKMGLYEAVLIYSHQLAISRYPSDAGLTDRSTAEEKLRAFIRSFLLRFLAEGFPAWHGKLMMWELADPTGALDTAFKRSIRPLHDNLSGIVQELFMESGARESDMNGPIHLCTMSVIGQCVHQYFARHIIASLRPKEVKPPEIEQLVDHITRFSLAGIHEYASTTGKKEKPARRVPAGGDR